MELFKDPAFKVRHIQNHTHRLTELAAKALALLAANKDLSTAKIAVGIHQSIKDENNEESIKKLRVS